MRATRRAADTNPAFFQLSKAQPNMKKLVIAFCLLPSISLAAEISQKADNPPSYWDVVDYCNKQFPKADNPQSANFGKASACIREEDYRRRINSANYRLPTATTAPVLPTQPHLANEYFPEMTIEGKIDENTVSQVQKFSDENKGRNPVLSSPIVYFNSPGGSLDAAMEIGRIIRKNQYYTEVAKSSSVSGMQHTAKCASACVFAFAGGGLRWAFDNQLGIHRPYFDTVKPINVKKAIENLENVSRDYFKEMGISQRLVDDMMVVPSNEMTWLTNKEAKRYGLVGEDLINEEEEVLYFMKKFNLSRDVYEKRHDLAPRICGPEVKWIESESREKHFERVEECLQRVLRTGK
jgi:hypothetical protein